MLFVMELWTDRLVDYRQTFQFIYHTWRTCHEHVDRKFRNACRESLSNSQGGHDPQPQSLWPDDRRARRIGK